MCILSTPLPKALTLECPLPPTNRCGVLSLSVEEQNQLFSDESLLLPMLGGLKENGGKLTLRRRESRATAEAVLKGMQKKEEDAVVSNMKDLSLGDNSEKQKRKARRRRTAQTGSGSPIKKVGSSSSLVGLTRVTSSSSLTGLPRVGSSNSLVGLTQRVRSFTNLLQI